MPHMLISYFSFEWALLKPMGPLVGPLKSMDSVSLSPLPPSLGGPASISRYLCPHKKFRLKFLMTSFHVICGLAPLPIKNSGYAYGRYAIFKNYDTI